jgi:hypothetical protein
VKLIGDLTDRFAVQDDVTQRIAEALKITLSPAEKERLPDTETSNVVAYDCVLRGRVSMLGRASATVCLSSWEWQPTKRPEQHNNNTATRTKVMATATMVCWRTT